MRLLKWRPSKLTLTAHKNRQEILAAGLTRRDLMKMGLISGSGYLAAKSGLSAWASGGSVASLAPPTTPFTEELVVPAVVQPTTLTPTPAEAPVAGEVARNNHLFWNQLPPQKSYELVAQQIQHSFHAQLPLNTAWGWGGTVPGLTVKARYGEPITVRMRNALPTIQQHVGFGRPEVSTHLHNLHNASASDGYPVDFYPTDVFKDHHYLNTYAGFTTPQFAPLGDPREALGTLWYHDHRVDFTAQNTYRGLAGFYLLYDPLDSGDETDPNPAALRLPSGEFDVPLQVVDRVFDDNGQLFFDLFNLDGIIGDKFIVNGKIQPFFKVARRKYRFRILNSGPSRFYAFYLSNGATFQHISNDGNLLPAPVTTDNVRVAVAERVDIVVDFSACAIGDKIYLENRLEQVDGRGPTGTILPPGQGNKVLEVRVDRDAPDPSQVPATLRDLPPVDLNAVAVTRVWEFGRSNGAWTVNGQFFDNNVIRARPRMNNAEIWVLRNTSGGWSHPIHIHFEEFQVITMDGAPPTARNAGRKDVIELGRANGSEAHVFMRFRDMKGRYVMHCHNTLHEDHAMMIRWDIV